MEDKNTTFSKDEVILVAKRQQWLLIYFALNLFAGVSLELIPEESLLIFPVALIAIFCPIAFLVIVYKLANALRKQAGLYIIGCFLPLVNIILIINLISSATKALRENNIKVGIMGAKRKSLEDFISNSVQ